MTNLNDLNEDKFAKQFLSIVLEELHQIESQLELCEKALAQYLESKKINFPRFYFVATADLLEILSNGNSPKLIQR